MSTRDALLRRPFRGLAAALMVAGCSSSTVAGPGTDSGMIDGGVADGSAPDASVAIDGAAVPDIGPSTDTFTVTDTVTDTVTVTDTGVAMDTGTVTDTGMVTDTGAASDAGTVTDTGAVTDTGSPVDAGLPATGTAVTTFQFDLQRTGANRSERVLTPAALMAGRFGRDGAFAPALDGQVYAQPLYLPGLRVHGATHDVLFVATQSNTVYALDAATGTDLWHTGLGTPVPRTAQPCGNITPTTGVLGTPVIDLASGTLYAVAYTLAGAVNTFTINALDVATGVQRAGYPTPINPPDSNGSHFDPRPHGERSALTLVDGRLYVPFGGLYGDCGTYHGWVVGIDPRTPGSQTAFATPGRGSGIWAVGGAAADTTGHLYVATGNATPAGLPTPGSMGEFILRLRAGAAGPTASMATADYFSPSNASQLDRADLDIGSNGPVVLPDVGGVHLLAQGNKAGVVYLLNRDNLGGVGTGDGMRGEGAYSSRLFTGGIYGASGAWSNGTDTWLFVPGRGARSCAAGGTGGVMALRVTTTGGTIQYAPAWCTASAGNPNPPAVSSNGNRDAILWTLGAPSGSAGPGTFRAYNAADGTDLWTAAGGDIPTVRQWLPPMVADGRVYIAAGTSVQMYRLVR